MEEWQNRKVKPINNYYKQNKNTNYHPNSTFRSIDNKQCTKCKKIKSRKEFYKNNQPNRDPNVTQCKICYSLREKQSFLNYPSSKPR